MVDEMRATQDPQEEMAAGPSPVEEMEATQVDLQQELDQALNEAEQWRERYLRSAAELANYRKRVEREREQQFLRTRMDVLRQLLPIVDDFNLALANVPPDHRNLSWVEGLLLIAGKIDALFSQSGVELIPSVGEPFDPVYHDALMQEENDDYPEGIVSGEIRKGYIMGDQVLRPTLVRVSAGPRTQNKV